MGNLTDIGYGVSKYLVASDASAIPDIGTNRKNLDLLNFKVATNNAYSLYNFKDGMIDAYEDTSGVDTGSSTNDARNSGGKYYSGTSGPTGGTITSYGSYTVNTFLTTANFVVGLAGNVDILLVGGGASGGSGHQGGGGGGAGGFINIMNYPVIATTYAVTVGTGGAGQTNNVGINGVNTTFVGNSRTLTGNGGGAGSGDNDPNGTSTPAIAGGSGGGGGRDGQGSLAAGNQPTNTSDGVDTYNGSGYGNGGAAGAGGPWGGAGGGGGSGASGSAGTGGGPTSANEYGGPGGIGSQNDFRTGSDVYYAGGGGGASEYNVAQSGDGGNGGGGKGCNNGTTATAGTANTGGAGGGASNGGTGGAGGSGIVVLRHTTGTMNTYNNMTLVSNAQTAEAAPDTVRLMLYEEASTGTITLDTDLKGYVSRDNGTTYTQTTLTLDTTYETGKRLVSGSVDISGQPSGTSMRYKIETLNQSVSKVCRLYGASLLWA